MTTEAQTNANRKNARRSTGPKTPEGKAMARLNALKRGRRAKIVFPVLPQEDPKELQQRIQQYFDDLQPRNILERELVARAARLSWRIERGERFETAHLARRVRGAQLDDRADPAPRVSTLIRRLLYNTGPRDVPGEGPPWEDDPRAFLTELESTLEGCRWLLEQWTHFWHKCTRDGDLTMADGFRFIRLMGKHPSDAVDDPELNRLFQAWDRMGPERDGQEFWRQAMRCTPAHDPGFHEFREWRVIAEGPRDTGEAIRLMVDTIAGRVEKYRGLVAVHEHTFGHDAFERADAASFDMSADFQRFRRGQTALTRELHQTIDQLMKLRKSGLGSEAPRSQYKPGTMTNEPDPPARTKPKRRGLPVAEETAMEMARRLARMMNPVPGTCPPSAPSSMQTKPIPEEAPASFEMAQEVREVVPIATIEPNPVPVRIRAEGKAQAGESGPSSTNEANPVISQISTGKEVAAAVAEAIATNEAISQVTPGGAKEAAEDDDAGAAARERTHSRAEARTPQWPTGDQPGARMWGESGAGHARDHSPNRSPG